MLTLQLTKLVDIELYGSLYESFYNGFPLFIYASKYGKYYLENPSEIIELNTNIKDAIFNSMECMMLNACVNESVLYTKSSIDDFIDNIPIKVTYLMDYKEVKRRLKDEYKK